MIQLEDLPEGKLIAKVENSESISQSDKQQESGNFLLEDFLKQRLDDSLEEGYNPELLVKLNNLLEKDILGGDDDEFDDGQTAQSTKNTDDNVAEQIALIKAHKGQNILQNSELDKDPLKEPLLDPEVALEPIPLNEELQDEDPENPKKLDQQTVFYDVRSMKEESEMYTVQDGGLRTPVPEKVDHVEQNQEEEGSVMEELEFRSALEFQSVYSFSKQGDIK